MKSVSMFTKRVIRADVRECCACDKEFCFDQAKIPKYCPLCGIEFDHEAGNRALQNLTNKRSTERSALQKLCKDSAMPDKSLSQVPRELASNWVYKVHAWRGKSPEFMQAQVGRLEAVIREAMQKAQPQWISVEEKLPEDGEQVLTSQVRANGERITATSHYAHDNKPEYRWYVEDQGFAIQPVVTHWMPLPELPNTAASSLTEQETTK